MSVEINGYIQGPSCYQLKIRLAGKHERGCDYAFKVFLRSNGIQIDKDYGGNARGYYELTAIVNPERVSEAKRLIKDWGSNN